MPQILNAKRFIGGPYPPNSAYVGRGRGSILGNPFTHLTKDTLATNIVGSREEAVSEYEKYARNVIAKELELFPDNPDKQIFINAVKALKGKDLVCWCAPYACHASVLIILCEELTQAA